MEGHASSIEVSASATKNVYMIYGSKLKERVWVAVGWS